MIRLTCYSLLLSGGLLTLLPTIIIFVTEAEMSAWLVLCFVFPVASNEAKQAQKKLLPASWRVVKLEDAADIINGGTPKTSNMEYWGGDIAWITPKDLSNRKRILIDKGERNISAAGLDNSSARLLPKGTVLLTSRAPIGYLAVANNSLSTNQGFKGLIVKKEEAHNMFIYYWLKTKVEYLKSIGSGSVFGEISAGVLKNVNICLPKLPEQKAIAEILSSLDDKIDLLYRQNKTLESIAQTLFRKWFIEGVNDNMARVTVNDLCTNIASGGTPFTEDKSYYNGDINWYTTKELQDDFLFESKSKITQEGLDNSSAKLFPKGTVLIAIYAAPTVGRLGILANESAFNQAACGLIADDNKSCKEFIYLYLKSQRGNLNQMSSGSAQQNLNVARIRNYPVILPEKKTMEKFKESVVPMFNKIEANTNQIRTLEKLRDSLLPKLISGNVRTKEFVAK